MKKNSRFEHILFLSFCLFLLLPFLSIAQTAPSNLVYNVSNGIAYRSIPHHLLLINFLSLLIVEFSIQNYLSNFIHYFSFFQSLFFLLLFYFPFLWFYIIFIIFLI
jgi:hypothetical protein